MGQSICWDEEEGQASGRQPVNSVKSCRSLQIPGTLIRARGTRCKKVVKVIHQVCNIVLIQQDPFHHIHHGIKNVRRRAENEGEGQIDKELAMPLHPQKIPILWINCDITIRSLHHSPRPMLGNHADYLVELNIVHSKFVRIDTVVHT